MRRHLLDTGIASDYINRRRGIYERPKEETKRGNRIGIAMPVLMELWYGVEMSATRERNVAQLRNNLGTS
jgi:tRNA(fMet)-specific endonuclease VapC